MMIDEGAGIKIVQAVWRMLVLALACVASTAAARAELISVPVDWQGRKINLSLDFAKPQGAGPFAVIILLPGCSAELDSGLDGWITQLHAWGYASLRVNSTEARGL